MSETLMSVFLTLKEQERQVLCLYYGMSAEAIPPLTLQSIALRTGLTKGHVRDLRAKALMKLRNPLRSEPLRQLTLYGVMGEGFVLSGVERLMDDVFGRRMEEETPVFYEEGKE